MPKNKLLRNEKLRTMIIERAEKFISHEYWQDINLHSIIHKEKIQISDIQYFSPSYEGPNRTDCFKFEQLDQESFSPAVIGQCFGPSWATHWFRVRFVIPMEWTGEEVWLLWDNGSEGMIWSEKGEPLQGLYGGNGDDSRTEFVVGECCKGGEEFVFYIEMACTGLFGNPGPNGFLTPPTDEKTFTLGKAEITVLNKLGWELFWDFDVILGMAKELDENSNRAWQASVALEKIMNTCYPDDPTTFEEAKEIADEFFGKTNGSSQHEVIASGHCHIDTAWLWTYSETRRKCARSWASQITYMEKYPSHIFVASQAQQHQWMKENYPGLYDRMKKEAANGRFIPTGGTWVEMDCNIPSGESFIRQFLYGQNFFEKEYGAKSTEFWLPDTFGYASQLPQIIRGSGIEFFLTQKLSWNLINKFPHNTFIWEGPDGSQVLSHFPPADTYCAKASVEEVVYTVTNHKNKGASNHSLLLFGIGDGGGGPQLKNLERVKRMSDVDGLPKVNPQTPNYFFNKIKEEVTGPTWCGELYFELHQGTYTTHAAVKKGNRKNEFLLRLAEFVSVFEMILRKSVYPQEELERLWKLLLLNQFHDVIPGTSIGHVYTDTREHYADIEQSATNIYSNSISAIFENSGNEVPVLLNTLSWPRTEIVNVNGTNVVASVGAFGFYECKAEEFPAVTIQETDQHIVMENQFLKVAFNLLGQLVSVFHKETQHESLTDHKIGNQFAVFDDVPFFWDAWDVMYYHKDKRRNVEVTSIKINEVSDIKVSVELTHKISETSLITQNVYLDAVSEYLTFDTHVMWNENRKFLKVEFPLNVSSEFADYSSQFGNSTRTTHTNTSMDMAQYEVCGHHWADLSEYGFGVALLNDCKYGYACDKNVLRLSLLRSPKRPDATADVGEHTFKYALYPHIGDFKQCNLVRTGYNFNVPVEVIETGKNIEYLNQPLFDVDRENIVIETLKKEEKGDNIVVRVWESLGGRGRATISTTLPLTAVHACNLIESHNISPGKKFKEEDTTTLPLTITNSTFTFSYTPYQIQTFILTLSQ